MELTVIDADSDVSHIRLSGRMDPYGSQKVRARLRAETIERSRHVIVDMTEVTFITSVGIGLLIDCADSVHRAGHRFVIVKATGHVNEVLRKTGVYTIVANADTTEEAQAIVAGDQ